MISQQVTRENRKNASLAWKEGAPTGASTFNRTQKNCLAENCGNSFSRYHVPDLNSSFARCMKGYVDEEARGHEIVSSGSFASDTMYVEKRLKTIE